MTQVLVVLAFMVDIFTIACSFLSCSIKDLYEPREQIYCRKMSNNYLSMQQHYLSLHVLFLKHLDFLL